MSYSAKSSSGTLRSKEKQAPPNFSAPGPPQLVTIIVEDEKFMVLKSFISYHSPFFRKAFTSNFIEGQTQEMTLREVDAPVFGLLVNWLYIQKVTNSGLEPAPVKLIELGKLWMLAQRCLIPRLQNAILDLLVVKFQALKDEDLDEVCVLMGSPLVKQSRTIEKVACTLLYSHLRSLDVDRRNVWVDVLPSIVIKCFFKALDDESRGKPTPRWRTSKFYEKVEEDST